MIRGNALPLFAAITLLFATGPANAEGPPPEMKARQQERESKRDQMKVEMRQIEDKQRHDQRELEDRHDKERKALRDKHKQEREALRRTMSSK